MSRFITTLKFKSKDNIIKWMWIIFVFIGIMNIPNNVIGYIANPIVVLVQWVVLLLFIIVSLWIWSLF